MYYHLGLICSQCMDYFTMSMDAMCWHAQLYKRAVSSIDDNDDWEEESEDDDNGGDYNDEFTFDED